MKTLTLTLNIPDTLEFDNNHAKRLIAASLYEKGKLYLGQAAELAGLSKQTFMEILGDYDVSIFNYSVSDLEKELKNAKNYHF